MLQECIKNIPILFTGWINFQLRLWETFFSVFLKITGLSKKLSTVIAEQKINKGLFILRRQKVVFKHHQNFSLTLLIAALKFLTEWRNVYIVTAYNTCNCYNNCKFSLGFFFCIQQFFFWGGNPEICKKSSYILLYTIHILMWSECES